MGIHGPGCIINMQIGTHPLAATIRFLNTGYSIGCLQSPYSLSPAHVQTTPGEEEPVASWVVRDTDPALKMSLIASGKAPWAHRLFPIDGRQ